MPSSSCAQSPYPCTRGSPTRTWKTQVGLLQKNSLASGRVGKVPAEADMDVGAGEDGGTVDSVCCDAFGSEAASLTFLRDHGKLPVTVVQVVAAC